MTSVALGVFDGLHLAHLAVILPALNSDKSICVTFSHPIHCEKAILTQNEKREALKNLGFSEIKELDFLKVKDRTPKEFLDYVCDVFSADEIVCGYNYRFGKNACGDVEFLKKYCEKRGIKANIISEVTENGKTVSSTLIREYIASGEVEEANKLLLSPFGFSAKVIDGDKRGRTLDFPTLNQEFPKEKIAPKFGVYISRAHIDGKVFDAVTNFGIRPTYRITDPLAETYVFGFSEEIYGKTVKIELLKYLREEKEFSGIDQLKKQITEDKMRAERLIIENDL